MAGHRLVSKKALISPKVRDVANWTAAIGGGSAIGGAATQRTTHSKKKTGAAVAGGLAAQGAYQGSAYGAKQYMRARTGANLSNGKVNATRRGERKDPLLRADHVDTAVRDKRKAVKVAHIKANTKAGVTNWKEVHRTFPKELPYHKAERLLSHTHGGKTGIVAGTAATIGGASLAANVVGNRRPVAKAFPKIKARARSKVTAGLKSVITPIDKPIVHHAMAAAAGGGVVGGAFGAAATGATIGHRQKTSARGQNVSKGLYQRESRPSLLRAAEMGAGVGLAAWGAGRSRMLGAALGRGVKAANGRGDARALYALEQAQTLQGVLRRGTAPGERHVRQIRSLNAAINAIPAPLRPEIATAAGLLLASNAHPVYRTHYRPISTNVQFRRVF